MKVKGEESERSWKPVNSEGNKTSQEDLVEVTESDERRAMQQNVTEQEEREPKREELQQIIQLMDGFKASKVITDSMGMIVGMEAPPV